jgi:hypothetical protein
VFGPNSARLYEINPRTKRGIWDTKFSVAAFDIQASALMNMRPPQVQQAAEQIKELFLFMVLTDGEMQSAISRHTSGTAETKIRWTRFRQEVEGLIRSIPLEPRFFAFEFRRYLFNASPVCKLAGFRDVVPSLTS